MLLTYLRLTLRHFQKRKVYSFINIAGLALGISVCLVIWKYIEFELSYDSFHRNADRTYLTTFTEYGKNWKDDWYTEFGYGLGPAMINEIPGVKNYVRLHPMYGDAALISFSIPGREPALFRERNILFADSTFFDVFTHEVIDGNLSTALDNPSSMVITEAVASRYFANLHDAVGKTMHIRTKDWGDGDYTITAVIKDVPQNSHLAFSILLSMHNLLQTEYYRDPTAGWAAMDFTTYVELDENTSPASLEMKTKRFMDQHTGTEPLGVRLSYQPLREINLSPDLNNPNGHISMLYFFMLISVFILCIAWINYINLSTARATERAREVGIKKAMGVLKGQLVMQFITEALLTNFISVVLAMGLAVVFLPVLGGIIDKNLAFDFYNPVLWIVLAVVFVAGTLVSGSYPAFVLSSFNPVDVIKSKSARVWGGLSVRKALVVVQFTASLLLITGTFIIYRQMHFMLDRDKGLKMDRMLIVSGPQIIGEEASKQRMASFKNELLKLASVKGVTSSGAIPGGGFSFTTGMYVAGKENDNTVREAVHVVWVDPDFIQTYGMQIMSGEPWDPARVSDMSAVFINEAVLESFGIGTAEEALGKDLVIGGDKEHPFTVQGVIKNFHWNSLQTGYVPMLFRPQDVNYNLFTIRVQSGDSETVKQVQAKYKEFFPGDPFDYHFLEDSFNAQYRSETQFGRIFGMFAILAIVIACLGLWGLASFTTEQRLKEISIRKVLGATVSSIIGLLSGQFVKLFCISGLIALPAAWYWGKTWTDNFAFRINITADLLIVPLLVLLAIALSTVSLQIFRGANTNPAKVLRSE